jgi:hypothetical protein
MLNSAANSVFLIAAGVFLGIINILAGAMARLGGIGRAKAAFISGSAVGLTTAALITMHVRFEWLFVISLVVTSLLTLGIVRLAKRSLAPNAAVMSQAASDINVTVTPQKATLPRRRSLFHWVWIRGARTFLQVFLAGVLAAPLLDLPLSSIEAAALAGLAGLFAIVHRLLDETPVPSLPDTSLAPLLEEMSPLEGIARSALIRGVRTFLQAFLAGLVIIPALNVSHPGIKAALVGGLAGVITIVLRLLEESAFAIAGDASKNISQATLERDRRLR